LIKYDNPKKGTILWRYYQPTWTRRPNISVVTGIHILLFITTSREEFKQDLDMSGIALAGCVPEVYDFKELISWCIDKFDKNQRIIQLQGESPISLAPSVFKRMLRLPEPTMTFKSVEAKDFLKTKNGGFELLQDYLEDPTILPEDLSSIQVSSLKNPYREMVWLFARVVGQESTTTVPRLTLYILYFSIHENTMFDWERIISSELSFQLGNFRKNKKFYMSSYLIFTITYCHVFKGFPLAKQVNCKLDLVQMWYPTLWKQKATYHFYEVKQCIHFFF
jgi:hypothetical protein